MGEKSCLYGKTTSMLDKGTRFLIASLPRNLKIYLLLLFKLFLGNFLAGKISCSCSRSWNESPSIVLFLTFIFRQQLPTYYHVCLLIFMHSKIYSNNLIFVYCIVLFIYVFPTPYSFCPFMSGQKNVLLQMLGNVFVNFRLFVHDFEFHVVFLYYVDNLVQIFFYLSFLFIHRVSIYGDDKKLQDQSLSFICGLFLGYKVLSHYFQGIILPNYVKFIIDKKVAKNQKYCEYF